MMIALVGVYIFTFTARYKTQSRFKDVERFCRNKMMTTGTTGITNVTQGSQVVPVPPAPAASAVDPSITKPLAQPSNHTISPRIVVDPSAGVIIQFLSSNGQIQNQIPSSTVVAYLRAGLTPEGLQKPQTTRA
jgi:hypothetical protein